MKLANIFAVVFLIFFFTQSFGQLNNNAVNAFIKRVVNDKSVFFEAQYISRENGKDVFEIESKKDKIILRGSNGLSVASALNYYLRNYCHCLITWNGTNLNMPQTLPLVKEKIHKTTPYQYRYYLNYCTFNYSMSWWNFDRWQKEIDWMALNGINMPLAITGEEAIWQSVYKDMGFSDDELKKFFCGPAYFSWFWMGNLDAWGGPLPQHWIDSHKELQKNILKAERDMGMTPVLASFTGHVPPSFKEKFPNAKLKKTNWGNGFDDTYILDPTDPMFEEIGKKFLAAQTKEYGTDHLYSADTFNENAPPSNDSTYLDALSKKLFGAMTAVDPKAVWVMQGWMFHSDEKYWQPAQIKALLNAIPNDRLIILDLYSEEYPIWNRTDAYYGKPWIWNMLHNFGGNVFMWGRMDVVANEPSKALHSAASGKMNGIGLTPEGIEQNPVMYQLMMDNTWTDRPIDVDAWLKDYALQRYGKSNNNIDSAWKILHKTLYNGALDEGGTESIIQARPTLDVSAYFTRTNSDYNTKDILPAWTLFINASSEMQASEGFQYDVVDVTRQVLANYALPLHQKFTTAFLMHDTISFNKYSNEFLELMDDMDKLLATRKDFLLGKWIADARSNGIDSAEKNLYEMNARDIITLWGNKENFLHEYACKQWSGLISGFYKPRWQQYFSFLHQQLIDGTRFSEKHFEEQIKNWEWNWVNSHEPYATSVSGDAVAASKAMYDKYFSVISNTNL